MKKNKMNVSVLLSGGIDSTATVAFYLNQGFTVSALFVDYTQAAGKREEAAASSVCKYYGIPMYKIVSSGFRLCSGGYIKGRNAFLLYAALMAFEYKNGIIAIGIHSGTRYPDCSEYFIRLIQSSFNCYAEGRICIDAPFMQWYKREIWEYCKKMDVPIALTYSCELGKNQPCGQCPSCKGLEVLYAC